MSSERWLPVVGFEGLYEVSDLGRVRGLDRIDGQGRRWPGRVLVQPRTRGGYLQVGLSREGVVTRFRLNVLVLATFSGSRPKEQEAAHLNGDRTDNRFANLEWKTKAENERDKRKHGTVLFGAKCPWAKLDEAAVRRIRARKAAGETFIEIARDLGMKYQAVYDAGTGRRWTHV